MLDGKGRRHGQHNTGFDFFTVEQVKKHELKYKLSSKIIRVGTILDNLEIKIDTSTTIYQSRHPTAG